MQFSKAKDQVSHPHVTKRKIIDSYILILAFSGSKEETRRIMDRMVAGRIVISTRIHKDRFISLNLLNKPNTN